MARIRPRRVYWDPVSDADGYEVYLENSSRTDFLEAIDAGQVEPFEITDVPEVYFDDQIAEGRYQIAVTAFDAAGNYSDPYQAEVWRDVPLDLTPPAPPTNGGID